MQETPKQPKGFTYAPDKFIQLYPLEYEHLSAFLKMFEMPLAIIENVRHRAIAEGSILPVFEEDILKDENGNPIKNPDGSVKLRDDFFKKEEPKPKIQLLTDKN